MHDEPVTGTRSQFGTQVLSNRASSPAPKFGSGVRTSKLHEKAWAFALLGTASPGPTCGVKSSFGPQFASRCESAPACRMPKSERQGQPLRGPGPGAYAVPTDTIGVELHESRRPTSAACKLGRASRWSEFKAGLTGEAVQALLLNTKPARGSVGDAPAWSFHGPQQRRPPTAGCSDLNCPLAPTSVDSPGPGAYRTELSTFGSQVDPQISSSPGVRVPRASRDGLVRTGGVQAIGPTCAQISSLGAQVTSRARSAPGIKFGSSDRFSDFKLSTTAAPKRQFVPSCSGSSRQQPTPREVPRATSRTCCGSAGWPDGPGPGAYVV